MISMWLICNERCYYLTKLNGIMLDCFYTMHSMWKIPDILCIMRGWINLTTWPSYLVWFTGERMWYAAGSDRVSRGKFDDLWVCWWSVYRVWFVWLRFRQNANMDEHSSRLSAASVSIIIRYMLNIINIWIKRLITWIILQKKIIGVKEKSRKKPESYNEY